MDQTKKKLEDFGIQPSFQRLKIYRYLSETKEHPSVDTVYKDLHPEIPTLSKTTVYNTMKLFMAKKLITAITIEEDILRFDADTSSHGHFKCRNCGKVYDFEFSAEKSDNIFPKGFQPDTRHFYAWGICPHCQKDS